MTLTEEELVLAEHLLHTGCCVSREIVQSLINEVRDLRKPDAERGDDGTSKGP